VLAVATAGTSITASYNSSTETLTLNGSDTLAHYQQVLDSLTFSTPSPNPDDYGSNPTRTVTWVLNDGAASNNLSTVATTTVSIAAINNPPTLAGTATSVAFTENGAAVTLSPSVAVSDPDNQTLAGATVAIAGGTFSGDGDVLAADTTGTAITASYNSATETLVLSGSDTLADYQQVLDSVTFTTPSDNPAGYGSNPTRTIAWVLNDGSASTSLSAPQTETVGITAINDAPTLSSVAASANFTEGGAAVTLAGSAAVTDPDNLNLVNATVKITGGTFTGDGDQLAVNVAGTSILGVYNPGTETLVLTGSDTLAHYQQVLDSLTFNEPGSLNPTNFGSNPTRTVTWVLNDGSGSFNLSTVVTETVSITAINNAPTLANVPSVDSYTENAAPLTVAPSLTVSDPDNLTLVNATVSVANTFAGDGDVLGFSTAGTAITASYNSTTEVLTLSGADTLAHYQQVLDSVTFSTPSDNPTDYGAFLSRVLTWTVNDGSASNNTNAPQFTTVVVTAVNDPPTLANVATAVSVRAAQPTVTVSPSLSVSDPDNLTLANATVKITGGTFSGDGDVLAANVAGTSITASYNAASETLVLSGSDTLAHYQQVLDSVTFNSTSANPTNSGADRTRTLTWALNDGSGSNNLSAPATTTITFAPPSHDDFNGDGNADLLLQNAAINGNVMIDLMNGTSITSTFTVTNPGGPSWQVVATGDFNNDGKADIVVQDTSGAPDIWLMNGTTIASTVALPVPPSSWHVIATGDFNGDGQTDILWQNTSGQPALWLMNGTSLVSSVGLTTPPASWRVIGAGDFNGDGKSDILWQNTSGQPGIWEMNGTSIVSAVGLLTPPPQWKVVGAGDFNGDGNSDILWINSNDDTVGIWEMNGTSIVSAVALSTVPPLSWTLVGAADVNGDGMSDLLWQNANTSQVGVWEMNGTSIIAAVAPTTPGNGWQLKVDGPIPPDQMGTTGAADPPPGGTMHLSAPDTNGTMHLSMPDGANGTGAPYASGNAGSPGLTGLPTFSLPPNFAAPMDGAGAAQLMLTSGGTTIANSLHIGGG
jgi:lipopolysaccharide export system protein LptA